MSGISHFMEALDSLDGAANTQAFGSHEETYLLRRAQVMALLAIADSLEAVCQVLNKEGKEALGYGDL